MSEVRLAWWGTTEIRELPEEIKEEGLGIHSDHKHRLRLFSQAQYAAQTPPPGCKIMTQKSLRSLLVALLVSSSCKSNPCCSCELSEFEDGFITENIWEVFYFPSYFSFIFCHSVHSSHVKHFHAFRVQTACINENVFRYIRNQPLRLDYFLSFEKE